VKRAEDSDSGDILVYGSATLVKALLHHDLIDENGVLIPEYQPVS
jgi:dihydrofolate reductase